MPVLIGSQRVPTDSGRDSSDFGRDASDFGRDLTDFGRDLTDSGRDLRSLGSDLSDLYQDANKRGRGTIHEATRNNTNRGGCFVLLRVERVDRPPSFFYPEI
jgi:hypothetical protein